MMKFSLSGQSELILGDFQKLSSIRNSYYLVMGQNGSRNFLEEESGNPFLYFFQDSKKVSRHSSGDTLKPEIFDMDWTCLINYYFKGEEDRMKYKISQCSSKLFSFPTCTSLFPWLELYKITQRIQNVPFLLG